MAKSTKPDAPKSSTAADETTDSTEQTESGPILEEEAREAKGADGPEAESAEELAGAEDEFDADPDENMSWDTVEDDPDESYDDSRDVYDDEDDEESEDYPAAETAHAPSSEYDMAPEPPSIWPAVLGGAIAAVLGFVLGRAEILDNYLPSSLRRPSVDLSTIESDIERLDDAVGGQASRLEAMAGAAGSAVDDTALEELKSTVAEVAASLETLKGRLETLEARPVAVAPPTDDDQSEALAGLQQALDSQKQALDAQAQELEKLKGDLESAESDAASEAQRILARAALTRVITAVDTGDSFEPALVDLQDSGAVDVPPELVAAAPQGVPTLAELRDTFPEAARAALAAARADPEAEQGFSGFLKRQLGARSVVPREGDDADAVLSRAEAYLKAGKLTDAIKEIDTLPPSAKDALSGWLSEAQSRASAQSAAQSLSQNLSN